MAERSLVLENYRNLGVGKATTLVLNHSLKKEDLGGLVILVGPNNSGKSNVLDALRTVVPNKQPLSKDDRPDFLIEKIPDAKITFLCKDGEDSYAFTKQSSGPDSWNVSVNESPQIFAKKKAAAAKTVELLKAFFAAYQNAVPSDLVARFNALVGAKDENELVNGLAALGEQVRTWTGNYSYSYRNAFDSTVVGKLTSEEQTLLSFGANVTIDQKIANDYKARYGYNFLPNILFYSETRMTNAMLRTAPNSWSNSPLFVSLFRLLNINDETLKNLYHQYENTNNISVLRKFQKKIDPELDKITERFNSFYGSSTSKYSFELEFLPGEISFGLARDDKALNFQKQSTGFVWFFDLFFNALSVKPLNPGDILVLDEPGTCLTVHAQEELRDFLKQFALSNDITILLSTHSPFLVDPDNFDELRAVSYEGDGSIIKNDFHVTADDYPDTLTPISTSLTTRNSVVLDPSQRKIFVEGITDYDYLTAFKIALNLSGVVFLPINGLGKKGAQAKIISELLTLEKDPNILVDGDMAGIKFEENGKGTGATIVKLTDVDPDWKEIEDLFTPEEQSNWNLKAKRGYEAALLKQRIITGSAKVAAKTKENFKKLISHLANNI
jgi:energy-coupling factor transporter ATP-binding protein EcfA2